MKHGSFVYNIDIRIPLGNLLFILTKHISKYSNSNNKIRKLVKCC